jgi:hypothetical protein
MENKVYLKKSFIKSIPGHLPYLATSLAKPLAGSSCIKTISWQKTVDRRCQQFFCKSKIAEYKLARFHKVGSNSIVSFHKGCQIFSEKYQNWKIYTK